MAAILKNGRHFVFWNFFRWLTGFIKRAISKEYVCQFWCLFPEMKDSFTYLPHYMKLVASDIYSSAGTFDTLVASSPSERKLEILQC